MHPSRRDQETPEPEPRPQLLLQVELLRLRPESFQPSEPPDLPGVRLPGPVWEPRLLQPPSSESGREPRPEPERPGEQ
jgi:hypothetical protein